MGKPIKIQWQTNTVLEEFGKPDAQHRLVGGWLRCATRTLLRRPT